jgi:methionine-rich copper-binding protein CopC
MKRSLFIFVILMVTGLSVVAHGYVERTDPASSAELETAPEQIRVWFNEPLVDGSGTISAINSSTGEPIAISETIHDADDDTMIYATVDETLPGGAYIVTVSATVISDGHEPSNSFVFWVGEKNATAQPALDEVSADPNYMILGLFLGVFLAFSAVGFLLFRRNAMDIDRPASDVSHFELT